MATNHCHNAAILRSTSSITSVITVALSNTLNRFNKIIYHARYRVLLSRFYKRRRNQSVRFYIYIYFFLNIFFL